MHLDFRSYKEESGNNIKVASIEWVRAISLIVNSKPISNSKYIQTNPEKENERQGFCSRPKYETPENEDRGTKSLFGDP